MHSTCVRTCGHGRPTAAAPLAAWPARLRLRQVLCLCLNPNPQTLNPKPSAASARFSAYAKREWKYIVRTTHADNPNTKGSSSPEGQMKRTTFEEDVKVTGRPLSMYRMYRMYRTYAGASQVPCLCRRRASVHARLLTRPRGPEARGGALAGRRAISGCDAGG